MRVVPCGPRNERAVPGAARPTEETLIHLAEREAFVETGRVLEVSRDMRTQRALTIDT